MDTAGSPASIFATRDWLDLTIWLALLYSLSYSVNRFLSWDTLRFSHAKILTNFMT